MMFRNERLRELLAPAAQFVDPVFGHGRKIRGIGISLLARDQIRGWKFQAAVVLAQIGQQKPFQTPGLCQVEKALHRRILRTVVNTGEGAGKAREQELARRIEPQTIAGAAADNAFGRCYVQADLRIAVGPERRKAQIVVDTAVGQRDSFYAAAPVSTDSRRTAGVLCDRRSLESLNRGTDKIAWFAGPLHILQMEEGGRLVATGHG